MAGLLTINGACVVHNCPLFDQNVRKKVKTTEAKIDGISLVGCNSQEITARLLQRNILFNGRCMACLARFTLHHDNKLEAASVRAERTKNHRQEIINILLDVFSVYIIAKP